MGIFIIFFTLKFNNFIYLFTKKYNYYKFKLKRYFYRIQLNKKVFKVCRITIMHLSSNNNINNINNNNNNKALKKYI